MKDNLRFEYFQDKLKRVQGHDTIHRLVDHIFELTFGDETLDLPDVYEIYKIALSLQACTSSAESLLKLRKVLGFCVCNGISDREYLALGKLLIYLLASDGCYGRDIFLGASFQVPIFSNSNKSTIQLQSSCFTYSFLSSYLIVAMKLPRSTETAKFAKFLLIKSQSNLELFTQDISTFVSLLEFIIYVQQGCWTKEMMISFSSRLIFGIRLATKNFISLCTIHSDRATETISNYNRYLNLLYRFSYAKYFPKHEMIKTLIFSLNLTTQALSVGEKAKVLRASLLQYWHNCLFKLVRMTLLRHENSYFPVTLTLLSHWTLDDQCFNFMLDIFYFWLSKIDLVSFISEDFLRNGLRSKADPLEEVLRDSYQNKRQRNSIEGVSDFQFYGPQSILLKEIESLIDGLMTDLSKGNVKAFIIPERFKAMLLGLFLLFYVEVEQNINFAKLVPIFNNSIFNQLIENIMVYVKFPDIRQQWEVNSSLLLLFLAKVMQYFGLKVLKYPDFLVSSFFSSCTIVVKPSSPITESFLSLTSVNQPFYSSRNFNWSFTAMNALLCHSSSAIENFVGMVSREFRLKIITSILGTILCFTHSNFWSEKNLDSSLKTVRLSILCFKKIFVDADSLSLVLLSNISRLCERFAGAILQDFFSKMRFPSISKHIAYVRSAKFILHLQRFPKFEGGSFEFNIPLCETIIEELMYFILALYEIILQRLSFSCESDESESIKEDLLLTVVSSIWNVALTGIAMNYLVNNSNIQELMEDIIKKSISIYSMKPRVSLIERISEILSLLVFQEWVRQTDGTRSFEFPIFPSYQDISSRHQDIIAKIERQYCDPYDDGFQKSIQNNISLKAIAISVPGYEWTVVPHIAALFQNCKWTKHDINWMEPEKVLFLEDFLQSNPLLASKNSVMIIEAIFLPAFENFSVQLRSRDIYARLSNMDKFFKLAKFSFLRRFSSVVTASILIHDYFEMNRSRRLFPILNTLMEYKFVTKPKSSFFEDQALIFIFHHIFFSQQVFRARFSDLFEEKELLKLFQYAAEAFQLPWDSTSSFNNSGSLNFTIAAGHWQILILSMVWQLGNFTRDSEGTLIFSEFYLRSKKALKLICTLFLTKSWSPNIPLQADSKQKVTMKIKSSLHQRENDWEVFTAGNVSLALSREFFFICSNLLQYEWNYQSIENQCHLLNCLSGVILLLYPKDLTQYLPKILNIAEIGFSSGHPLIVEHALGVICNVSISLDFEDLEWNCAILVMILIDVLLLEKDLGEAEDALPLNISSFPNPSSVLSDLSKTGRGWSHTFREGLPNPTQVFDTLLAFSAYSSFSKKKDNIFKKIQAIAISHILQLVQKCNLIHPCFRCLPALPQFDSLRQKVSNELQTTLSESLLRLLELFRHQSRNVRFVAVYSCALLLKEKKTEFYAGIQAAMMNNEETQLFGMVKELQSQLLALTVSEKEGRIKIEVASCLGEMGMLDITFNQSAVKSTRKELFIDVTPQLALSSVRSTNPPKESFLTKETETIPPNQHLLTTLPWLTTKRDFGFYLLTNYFIPSLKLAQEPHSQDYSSLAIQLVIQELAKIYSSNSDENMNIPDQFKEELHRRNLFDVVEPFWNSKYKIFEGGLMLLPIFNPGISFSSWIGFLTKFCIAFLANQTDDLKERFPFIVFYQSCSSLVKHHPQLCQFILPYIILDIILLGSEENPEHFSRKDSQFGTAQEVAVAVFHEFIRIIRFGVDNTTERPHNEEFQVIMQAVFSLMDIFYQWTSEILSLIRERKPKVQISKLKERSCVVYHDAEFTFFALNNLIHVFPLSSISQVAFGIQSYARSLRYFEMAVLDKKRTHLQSNLPTSNSTHQASSSFQQLIENFEEKYSKSTKQSTYQLSENELFLISSIYSELEDSASLKGIMALRRSRSLDAMAQYKYKLIELQGSEDWLNSLIEYELLQSNACNLFGSEAETSQRITKTYPFQQTHRLREDRSDSSFFALHLIEQGKMKSLLELGHLERIIDQAHNEHLREELKASVIPYSVEAAWRLERWDDLEEALVEIEKVTPMCHSPNYDEDNIFRIQLGKLIHYFHQRDKHKFYLNSLQAKLEITSALSSLTMESYSLCYPLLCQLHIIRELEICFPVSFSSVDASLAGKSNQQLMVDDWSWTERIDSMPNSLHFRSQVFAARRFLYSELKSTTLLTQSWMQYFQALLHNQQFPTARYALQNIKLLDVNSELILLKESQLLYSQHQIQNAIRLLEPAPVNLSLIRMLLQMERNDSKQATPNLVPSNPRTRKQVAETHTSIARSVSSDEQAEKNKLFECLIANPRNRSLFAEKLLFSTKLLIESQSVHGSAILERFQVISLLNPTSIATMLEMAKYYEYLYEDLLKKESYIGTSSLTAHGGGMAKASSKISRNQRDEESMENGKNDVIDSSNDRLYKYIEKAIEKYGKCLQLTETPNIVIELLPKLLTLWLGFTAQTSPPTQSVPSFLENHGTSSLSNRGKGTSVAAPPVSSASTATNDDKSALHLAQNRVNKIIESCVESIAAKIWFISIQQIVSRVIHHHPLTTSNLEKILMKILLSFPKQSIWYLASLLFSSHQDRKKICRKLLNHTYKKLKEDSKYEEESQMLVDSQQLFPQLIHLASLQTKERKISFRLENIVNISAFLIPTKSVLLHSYHSFYSTPSASGSSSGSFYDLTNYYFTQSRLSSAATTVFLQQRQNSFPQHEDMNFMYIKLFQESVSVAASKARPKTIVIESVCGKKIKFLCKMEKDGDLRKDVHMMEFNHTVNRLLMHHTQSRKKKLRLRTYAVVCLNEECGLLEWVNNTECLRQAIHDSHYYYYNPLLLALQNGGRDNTAHQDCQQLGQLFNRSSYLLHENLSKDEYPNKDIEKSNFFNFTNLFPHVTYREVYQSFIEYQQKFEDDITQMTTAYQTLIYEIFRYQPALHRWFLERFTDPTVWMENRNIYVNSVAVWSAVGYIIGLGDRHTENVLLDVTNGECVHVDFDCLFDKGLTLAKPEIVPFRLTSNMIDAMGVIGIEGAFRHTLEISLQVLRDNKETLLNILEPFLRDPTVAWSRSGRAQRSADQNQPSAHGKDSSSGQNSKTVLETENKEAKEMLLKISDRLSGVYNIIHPHRDKFIRGALKRGETLPTKGIGPAKEELLPLSVSGQAQKLIEEATAEENLAQLYIGWQPWI